MTIPLDLDALRQDLGASAEGAGPTGVKEPRSEVTALPPGREPDFAEWAHRNSVTDLDHPESYYDYRGAYLAGVNRAPGGHWPDTYKQHGHPTFSVESQYSAGPDDGGHWQNGRYVPQGQQRQPVDLIALAEELKPHTAQPVTPPRKYSLNEAARRISDAAGTPAILGGGDAAIQQILDQTDPEAINHVYRFSKQATGPTGAEFLGGSAATGETLKQILYMEAMGPVISRFVGGLGAAGMGVLERVSPELALGLQRALTGMEGRAAAAAARAAVGSAGGAAGGAAFGAGTAALEEEPIGRGARMGAAFGGAAGATLGAISGFRVPPRVNTTPSGRDPFEVLGLDPRTATPDQVERAFREAAMRNHPDVPGDVRAERGGPLDVNVAATGFRDAVDARQAAIEYLEKIGRRATGERPATGQPGPAARRGKRLGAGPVDEEAVQRADAERRYADEEAARARQKAQETLTPLEPTAEGTARGFEVTGKRKTPPVPKDAPRAGPDFKVPVRVAPAAGGGEQSPVSPPVAEIPPATVETPGKRGTVERAMHLQPGAAERWQGLRDRGATDEELQEAVRHESPGYSATGLRPQQLAAVRRVLKIPKPTPETQAHFEGVRIAAEPLQQERQALLAQLETATPERKWSIKQQVADIEQQLQEHEHALNAPAPDVSRFVTQAGDVVPGDTGGTTTPPQGALSSSGGAAATSGVVGNPGTVPAAVGGHAFRTPGRKPGPKRGAAARSTKGETSATPASTAGGTEGTIGEKGAEGVGDIGHTVSRKQSISGTEKVLARHAELTAAIARDEQISGHHTTQFVKPHEASQFQTGEAAGVADQTRVITRTYGPGYAALGRLRQAQKRLADLEQMMQPEEIAEARKRAPEIASAAAVEANEKLGAPAQKAAAEQVEREALPERQAIEAEGKGPARESAVPGGKKMAAGETATTSSGRTTTPFPSVSLDTDRKAAGTLQRVHIWLRENAVAEAEARGDDYNANQFRREDPKRLPPATIESMNDYLFGDQPPLHRSPLKTVSGIEPGAPHNEAAVQEGLFGEKKLTGAEQTEMLPETAGVPTAKLKGTKIGPEEVGRVKREGAEPEGDVPGELIDQTHPEYADLARKLASNLGPKLREAVEQALVDAGHSEAEVKGMTDADLSHRALNSEVLNPQQQSDVLDVIWASPETGAIGGGRPVGPPKPATSPPRSIRDEFRRQLYPEKRGPEAADAARLLRKHIGEWRRGQAVRVEQLRGFRSKVPLLTTPEGIEWYDRAEGGKGQVSPDLQVPNDIIRRFYDELVAEVHALGTGKLENPIENYMAHIWEDPGKAKETMGRMMGRRPLQGGKTFLRQRTLPKVVDGLKAGLEPVTNNPIDLNLLKMREMSKYVMAHRFMADAKEEGLAKFVSIGKPGPDGWVRIDDPTFAVYGRSDAGELVIRGHYWMPEVSARVVNNYLSPGLRGNPIFDAWMGLGNSLNQATLGISGFHAGFVTFESMISDVARSIGKVMAGKNPLAGFRGPLASINNVVRGVGLRRAYLNPGTGGILEQRLADMLARAGGQHVMDPTYQNNSVANLRKAFRQNRPIAGLMHTVGAALQGLAYPTMELYVPLVKLGAFSTLAESELARLGPLASDADVDKAMQAVYHSIDNRFGQVSYDTRFWNNAVKHALMGTIRAVGWDAGSIDEMVGGLADALRGKGASLRFHYAVALPLTAAVLGILYQLALTGEGPSSVQDVFEPRDGTFDQYGNANRMNLATYMKDVLHFGRHPIRTIEGKLHPVLSFVGGLLSNRDFYGNKWRNPHDPLTKQLQQLEQYVQESFTPISIRNVKEASRRGESPFRVVQPFVGITPSSREAVRTPAQNLMADLLHERTPPLTPEQRQRADSLGLLRMEESGDDKLVRTFRRLTPDERARVFKVANPHERELWEPWVERRRGVHSGGMTGDE